jgi:hypothetical protein
VTVPVLFCFSCREQQLIDIALMNGVEKKSPRENPPQKTRCSHKAYDTHADAGKKHSSARSFRRLLYRSFSAGFFAALFRSALRRNEITSSEREA